MFQQTETLQFRVAINDEVFPTRKWPNNTVPYIISDKYGEICNVIMTGLMLRDGGLKGMPQMNFVCLYKVAKMVVL